MRIGIIVGSTRPGRRGAAVAAWVTEVARQHEGVRDFGATVELLDLAEVDLPLLQERAPAMFRLYEHDRTKAWADAVAPLDAFVFVTPEYNHSLPAALKNALDHLFAEWNDKAAGIVSYGTAGGIRAAEHLRQVLAELKTATVRSQVALSVFEDFALTGPLDTGTFTPRPAQEQALNQLLEELLAWASALRTLRVPAEPVGA